MPSLRKIYTALFICISLAVASAVNAQERIIGGTYPTANEGRYVSLVLIDLKDGNTARCSGSMITNSWVLTAAHCVDNAKAINVQAGVTWQYTYAAKRWVTAPGWSRDIFAGNDIALIELDSPTKYTPVSRIARYTPNTGDVTTMYGYGKTENFFISTILLKANTTIVDHNDCKVDGGRLNDSIICTVQPNVSACSGDSGGALVYNGKIVGVTSASTTNCPTNTANLFTNVPAYYDWIASYVPDAGIESGMFMETGHEGEGWSLTFYGNSVYIAGFIYDQNNNPTWVAGNLTMSPNRAPIKTTYGEFGQKDRDLYDGYVQVCPNRVCQNSGIYFHLQIIDRTNVQMNIRNRNNQNSEDYLKIITAFTPV